MKKKMRTASLAMALVLACTSLIGCGNSGNTNTSGAGTNQSTAADAGNSSASAEGSEAAANAAVDLEHVTLKFYFFDGKKSETDHVWEEIANYVNENYGLNVSFDVQFIAGSDYKEKMLVKAAAGDKWDLCFEGDWLSYYQMVNKDAYLSLEDLLPEYAPNLYQTYLESGVLEAAKKNGKVVALPWTMRMNQRPYFQWRGDLAESAGLNIDTASIQTIEDVEGLLALLKEAYPDLYTIECSSLNAYLLQENLVSIGNDFVVSLEDPDLKAIPVDQTDAYRQMAEYGEKWQKAGYIWKDVLTDKLDHNQLIDQGRLITKWGDRETTTIQRAWVDENAYWEYNMLYPENLWANRTALANCMCIPQTSENPERTLMFLELLHMDQDLYDMVHYGIPGLTYELNGEAADYPEGMNSSNSNYMDWGGRWGLWDSNFIRPTGQYSEGFWQDQADFADSYEYNVVSPLDGFNFDTEPVKTEMTQVKQLYDEAHKMIEVGLAGNSDAAVDKLIQDRKNAGIDKVLEELQKQIDEFLASK